MNFTALRVADYERLYSFFQNQPYPLSPYCLASLIAWSGQGYRSHWAVVGDTLLIGNEPTQDKGELHLLLPIPAGGEEPSPEQLGQLARQAGFGTYWHAPSTYMEKYTWEWIEGLFRVSEQPEYEDYVYLRDDLALLKGNRFAKKRNLIHQFTRAYAAERVVVESMSAVNAAESIAFLLQWCELRACDVEQRESLACEKQAIITTIENLEAIGSAGILIRIDGVVSAFGMGSRLREDTGVLNFEKALSSIKGLYQFLDRECARRLFPGCRYINKECDMNIPNLAQAKKSYNPIMMIKSYRLEVL